MISKYNVILAGITLLFCSCYNFKGINIPPEIQSYYVDDFTYSSSKIPVDLPQLFAEKLRRKVREQSRLTNNDTDPDVIYSGEIQRFGLQSVAPQEGTTTSLNRLTIAVKIGYVDIENEEKNWNKSYSAFEDFDATIDFQTVRDDIIENILEDITERIFNDTFTDW